MLAYDELIDVCSKKSLIAPIEFKARGKETTISFMTKKYLYREDFLFDNFILKAVYEIKSEDNYTLLSDRQVKNLVTKIKEHRND